MRVIMKSLYTIMLLLPLIAVNLTWAQGPVVAFPASGGKESSNDKSMDIQASVVIHKAYLSEENKLHLTIDFIEQWKDTSTQPTEISKVEVLNAEKVDDEVKIKKKSLGKGMFGKLTKLDVKIPCDMNFFYFPFDKQTCSVKLLNEIDSDTSTFQISANESAPSVIISGSLLHPSGIFHFNRHKISTFSQQSEIGQFNQSGIELQLLFVRERERAFPIFYFPVIALMMILFKSLFLKNRLHSVCVSLAVFLVMMLWVGIFQAQLPRSGSMTMLDHYHFLCLNLALNAVTVSIILHLFLQHGNETEKEKGKRTISESEQSVGFTDIKLELNSMSTENNGTGNGNETKNPGSHESVCISEDDPEAHIHKMGKFKQFVYFKACKPAKYQLPIVFVGINVIYWIWILVATLIYPAGFTKN